MESDKIAKVLDTAIEILIETNPIIGPVARALKTSAKDAEIANDTGEISKLYEEAKRQEISLQMAKMQAQVAQELAIAHRIETAEKVEIEEFYEGETSAGISGGTDGASVSFSLGGNDRKVTKRLYRFTGKNENT